MPSRESLINSLDQGDCFLRWLNNFMGEKIIQEIYTEPQYNYHGKNHFVEKWRNCKGPLEFWLLLDKSNKNRIIDHYVETI